MKKRIALLTVMMLVLSLFGAALAEEVQLPNAADDFEITMTLPEGYQMVQNMESGYMIVYVYPEKEDQCNYLLTIHYSELLDGQTMNELDDETKQGLLHEVDDDFSNPKVESLTTESGTEVYVINEQTDDPSLSFARGLTLYKGYIINIEAFRVDEQVLTQQDIDTALKLLSDLWFVEK